MRDYIAHQQKKLKPKSDVFIIRLLLLARPHIKTFYTATFLGVAALAKFKWIFKYKNGKETLQKASLKALHNRGNDF